MSTKHAKAAAGFLENKKQAAWYDETLWLVRAKRDKQSKEVPEWEELREMACETKLYSNSHLDELLVEFETNARANGWFLMSFGWEGGSFGMVEELNESILSKIGSAIAWIFAPLGWTKAGEGWKMAVAAVTGLIAKENVVATFGMLYGFAEVAEDGAEIWGNLAAAMTPIAAYGFLVFNLLCAPCFAAMGAIKREMNNTKWFFFAIGYQCGLAYLVSTSCEIG